MFSNLQQIALSGVQNAVTRGDFLQARSAVSDPHGALIDHAISVRHTGHQAGRFQRVGQSLRRSNRQDGLPDVLWQCALLKTRQKIALRLHASGSSVKTRDDFLRQLELHVTRIAAVSDGFFQSGNIA